MKGAIGLNNDYEFRDGYVTIFLDRKDGSRIETLIDTEDFELVMNASFKWYLHIGPRGHKYVYGSGPRIKGEKRKRYKLHRYILNAKDGYEVDHIDHNTLNNRKYNLREVPIGTNIQNRINYSQSHSKIRGVYWKKKTRKWEVRVQVNGKIHYIGEFKELKDAEKAAIEARANLQPYSFEAYLKNKAS